MALKKPNIHVGPGTWSSLAFFGPLDFLKFLSFFIDFIPVVGLPLGYFFTLGVCIFQMAGGAIWLILSGFLTLDDAVGMENFTWYWSLVAVSLIPVVDDMPYTTTIIFYRILATSRADAKAMKHYEHQLKKEQEHKKQEQEHKKQRAFVAVQNANNNRQQALNTSIKVANDNHSNQLSEAA